MINVLIVDDSNDKVAHVITAIRDYSSSIRVDVVIDFVTALSYLTTSRYDLLILDINLPVRNGEEPNVETGKNLLYEINRKIGLKSPYYIICLTQFENVSPSEIWRTIHYNPVSFEWKAPLINLIQHISKTGIAEARSLEKRPCIFVEGKTDEIVLKEAITLFRPEISEKLLIKSDRSAGASWVVRQIVAWAFSLKKEEGIYIKAIGIIDGDGAGKSAMEEITRVIRLQSAESKTFKMLKLSATYAKHIRAIKQKGLDLPVTLEEMFDCKSWKYAHENGWLELRNSPDNLLVNPEKWDKFEISLKDYLQTIGLTSEESLYLHSVKDDCKEKFIKYLIGQETEKRKEALKCFEKLVEEIAEYFFGKLSKDKVGTESS